MVSKKIIILGRTNWENGFYVKFEAEEKSMIIIKKIVGEMDSEYFKDNHTIPRILGKYEKWKDQWISVYSSKHKNLDIDIICGDKIIHMIVHKSPSFEFVNKILDKYCDWAEPEYKKGFGPPTIN